ncbi:hypothetical protein AC480_02365 [miscellaneous Crenarchaeota group archaeon SMTZ1-55]|nr:MAG: hypothetical protein AC480_02365 [miscellaneous Crenarchaeota group archaeon SMTZ1-55]
MHQVGQCYLSVASAVSHPALLKAVSEIIEVGSQGYPYTTVLTGIESGSPKLIEALMPGKAWPFKPLAWPEVVEQGFGLLNDNHWVPTGMLILGLPEEREEDVYETISLVERLKPYKSAFVPFLFKATSALRQEQSFHIRDVMSYHLELMKAVFDHNAYWGNRLITEHAGTSSLTRWLPPMASPIISWSVDRAYRKLFKEINARASRMT